MHRNPASRWFIRVLGSAILCGLLLGCFAILGSFVEAEYDETWTASVPVPPAEVVAALESPGAVGAWWSVDGVASGRTDDGEPAWIVRRGGDAVRLRVDPTDDGLVLTVAEDPADYVFTRSVRVAAAEEGSTITVREEGTVESKLSRAADWLYRTPARHARTFLADLSRHLGGTPPTR